MQELFAIAWTEKLKISTMASLSIQEVHSLKYWYGLRVITD